jgi:NAD(P)-dependent dehydrogenase (short-subunit alcohol dehydrogenase family)
MRALAMDLGKYGMRVNAVLPGMIRTDRWEKNPEFYKKMMKAIEDGDFDMVNAWLGLD